MGGVRMGGEDQCCAFANSTICTYTHLVAKVLAPPLYHTPFTQCHGLFLASPYRLRVPRVKSGPLGKDDQPCLRGVATITVSTGHTHKHTLISFSTSSFSLL